MAEQLPPANFLALQTQAPWMVCLHKIIFVKRRGSKEGKIIGTKGPDPNHPADPHHPVDPTTQQTPPPSRPLPPSNLLHHPATSITQQPPSLQQPPPPSRPHHQIPAPSRPHHSDPTTQQTPAWQIGTVCMALSRLSCLCSDFAILKQLERRLSFS